jgi:hypothetical protein
MARIAPIARPVFEWNHQGVMRSGGEGLAQYLASPAADALAEAGQSPYSRLA